MWFASSGRSSANSPQFAPWPEMRPDVGVMAGAPDLLARPARQRRVDRTTGRCEAPAGAADEAALLVGLVELERLDEVAELALPAHQRLLEQPGDVGERMHHQPLPDEAGRVRQAVGVGGRIGEQQQTGRADRVRRDDHHPRRLEVLGTIPVDPRRAGGEALLVGLDAPDPRAGDEARSPGDRLRPVREVGRRLRALVAARLARAALDARPAPVVGDRVDRVELRPPVPAQLGHAARDLQPCRPDRQRRHRRVLGVGRVRRVAGQPGHAEIAVGPVEVRQQLEVVDRPVVGDAVERTDAEVGRKRARPRAGEDDRRAADGVVHERRDRGVVLDDRVVLRESADVRARRPVLARLQLPVELVARVVGAVEPVALLEAHDAEAGLGESLRDDAARCTRSDDQDVRGLGRHQSTRPALTGSRSRPTSLRTSVRCARSSSEIGSNGRRTWAASSTPRMRRHSLRRTR